MRSRSQTIVRAPATVNGWSTLPRGARLLQAKRGGGGPTSPSTSRRPLTAAERSATIWENYDFMPGSKVLFFTDFTEDRVGNFSRRLKFVNGAMDVVDHNGVKVLRVTSRRRGRRERALRASATVRECLPVSRQAPRAGGPAARAG